MNNMKVLNDVEYPECILPNNLSNLNKPLPPEFYAFELIEDNEEFTSADLAFQASYLNSQDVHLGDDAPTDMYIANTLNQTSLIFSGAAYPNVLDFQFDENIHAGTWTF